MEILVVDDILDNLYFLKTLLSGSGYKVITAQNGIEALKKLKKSKVEIIISDILMPEMDGFQLCRACKKDEKFKKIPFLFYTATYKRKKDEKFALSLGAERFIIKPIEPDVLLKILDDVIAEHKREKIVTEPKELIKEELYLAEHNKRIIKKLEDKIKTLDEEITRREKTENRLKLKIKELNFLYSIVNLVIEQDITVEKVFRETVKHVSDGMQYPELTCSRVIFNGKEYITENFKKTKWKECHGIVVRGKETGAVEVCYLKKKPGSSRGLFSQEEKRIIKGVSNIISSYLERKLTADELKKSYHRIKATLDGIIKTLANIVEEQDRYTSGHQKRVAIMATAIAKELGMDEGKVEAINTAALIHDIGKIGVPASILTKPGKLTDIEFQMVKTHTERGYEILKEIEFPYPIAKIVIQHHERLDGSGYPYGLRDKDILLEARVIAVADVMEAMISHRPYRPALIVDKAIKEITSGKNKLYDSTVVDACIKLFKKKSFREKLEINK